MTLLERHIFSLFEKYCNSILLLSETAMWLPIQLCMYSLIYLDCTYSCLHLGEFICF